MPVHRATVDHFECHWIALDIFCHRKNLTIPVPMLDEEGKLIFVLYCGASKGFLKKAPQLFEAPPRSVKIRI